MSVVCSDVRREAFAEASRFRAEFYECLTARRDEMFELADALLCADGPVTSPVDLTMVPEHRRGHGALYGVLNRGRIDIERLRTLLAGLPLPRFEGGRLVLAVDVSPWLRSDAPCSADRLFYHVYGRAKSASQFIPGWCRVGTWAAANNAEIAYTPTNSSWLNRIEAQFTALRYFTLDGSTR